MGGHRNMEYAFFANEQAFASALLLIAGGLIGLVPYYGYKGVQTFTFWQIGAFGLAAGLLIFLVEYPRGKRRKGQNVERKGQRCFTIVMSRLGVVTRNYFIRFILYLLMGAACVFHLPTILGGVCLLIASLVYLVAGVKGEEWLPIEAARNYEAENTKNVAVAPTQPPPRRPPPPKATDKV